MKAACAFSVISLPIRPPVFSSNIFLHSVLVPVFR